jgi:hypothetical protein
MGENPKNLMKLQEEGNKRALKGMNNKYVLL